jgi:hypothetical protein
MNTTVRVSAAGALRRALCAHAELKPTCPPNGVRQSWLVTCNGAGQLDSKRVATRGGRWRWSAPESLTRAWWVDA